MDATAKTRIESAQEKIRKVMGWPEGEHPWMAERIRMLADGRASMITTEHLEQIAGELSRMEEDAKRYRYLRSKGLGFINWGNLTCDTCDVGLDYAIDLKLKEQDLLKNGDPFIGEDWDAMQDTRAEMKRIAHQGEQP